MVLFFSPCLARDNTTLVVFSRHTFRGISMNVGPQEIDLDQYDIKINIPTLSYSEDATPQGLIIAERFAAPVCKKPQPSLLAPSLKTGFSMVTGMKFAPSLPPSARFGQDCI